MTSQNKWDQMDQPKSEPETMTNSENFSQQGQQVQQQPVDMEAVKQSLRDQGESALQMLIVMEKMTTVVSNIVTELDQTKEVQKKIGRILVDISESLSKKIDKEKDKELEEEEEDEG